MQEILGTSSYTHGLVLRPVSENALDPQERSCCICYQPFRSTLLTHGGPEVPVRLLCGHVFGESCILSWTLDNSSCPLCRRDVFRTDDHPVDRRISISQDSRADILTAADQLDSHDWDSPAEEQLRETVSSDDIEQLLELYTSNRSIVYSSSQSQTSQGSSKCASDRDLVQHTDEDDTRTALLPHKRLTPSTAALSRPTDTENFDLTELGAQFAILDCHYKQWMDEYLNEPTFDEPSSSIRP
ncbi:uncharacterized protein EKO05_0011132 [Ascochyta rabiei]|uniref:Zinc ion binding n=1 Tax=Didymella rabiei TaxID=5454 RepID=A0A163A743_DIDRA|nr:uncharacterized protein EKO05_0011132 [Ascochyta rabiei]KZM21024.1 zinc ion binding [Ascochyta rabiei]UPX20920.1 hypothetical protein EKO05_0011132 [Ascochyta rabiei]